MLSLALDESIDRLIKSEAKFGLLLIELIYGVSISWYDDIDVSYRVWLHSNSQNVGQYWLM